MYCGLAGSVSIFSRIFRMCTVKVAKSPVDSKFQIFSNNWCFVKTRLGLAARKNNKAYSLAVSATSWLLTYTRWAEVSITKPLIFRSSRPDAVGLVNRSYLEIGRAHV